MKRRRKRQPRAPRQLAGPLDRATNPTVAWLHALAAMGDESWDEAIAALRHFLELADKPEDRRTAYMNLGACYLALERYDDALAMLDEVERYIPDDPEGVDDKMTERKVN